MMWRDVVLKTYSALMTRKINLSYFIKEHFYVCMFVLSKKE